MCIEVCNKAQKHTNKNLTHDCNSQLKILRQVDAKMPKPTQGKFKNEEDNISLEYEMIRGNKNSKLALILTHPYGLMGGSMHNNVTCAVFERFGWKYNTVLMFNFRGIGESEGWPTVTGWNERNDFKAACKFVLSLENAPKDMILIGYSAGSAIGCGCIDEVPELIAYCAIGYPVGWTASIIFGSHYPKAKSTKPKLFIQGDWDQFTSVSTLDTWVDGLEGEKEKVIIKGADHFFFGYEDKVVTVIEKWLNTFEKSEIE